MTGIDPGRLPYKQLMKDTERNSHASEARAELRAEALEERRSSPRGLRGLLRRLRRGKKGRQ